MNEFLNFFLDEAVDILVNWEKASLSLEQAPTAETKDELYRSAHNLKSGSGAVGLDDFHQLVHAVEDLISLTMKDDAPLSPVVIRIFLDTHSTLSAWIDRLRGGDERVPSDEIAAIHKALEPFFGKPVDAANDIIEHSSQALPQNDEKPTLTAAASAPAPASGVKSQETIRVAASKLDNLIELVGELATQQAIVWHGRQQGALDSDPCHNAIHLVQKISKDLQALSLSLRLQPLQGLFQRLERTIRDLARTQGKKVEVVLKGEDVELDKSVAERIADALTHVVRNALDHGVEISEEREANGKSSVATIILEAQPSASGVLIKIADDGRGLNAERIRKKAIERDLLSSHDDLPESEIHRLIFHAGLSTAEKITDVSGRGVGMDVVKTSVENIGGSIQLSSKLGQGTSFSISLPATLTIVDALLVGSGANLYALPLQDVAEIIDLGEFVLECLPGGSRMLRLRNSLIPLEDLAAHLPAERPTVASIDESRDSMQPAVLIRIGDQCLAFAVKRIIGQQLVTVRGLPTALASIPGYTGGTILGDGSPCVVLNLSALASRHFEQIHRGSSSASPSSLIAPTRFEESDLRCLVVQSGPNIFATSLMMVREILEDLPHENMPDSEGGIRRYIAVRGELIPVFDLGFYAEDSAEKRTYIVTADGHRAIGVSRVLAVSALASVESHRAHAKTEELSGIVGFRKFQDHYIPMLDLHLALETLSAAAQLSKGQRAS